MTFKKYAEGINKLLKENPETAEFDVVISIDDEGNGFNMVFYEPDIGNYDPDDRSYNTNGTPNAVCVN